jgi:hypothetical protein
VKENPVFVSALFGAFPSDRIPNATKDVNILIFFQVAIPVNYISKFRELSEAAT